MSKMPVVAPVLAALYLAASTAAFPAPLSAPQAVPVVRSVPDARDVPYPGTIRLDIDATDVERGVYRVVQTIPVAADARRLTLLFPQWLPGNHAPRGPLAELVDLRFSAGGKPLAWRRDPVDVYAFHIELPAGTREVTARYLHTSPLQPSEGRVTMTREMLNLQWEKMSLYPAGHYVRRIRVRPSVTIPEGWTAATALDGQKATGNRLTWDETTYEVLVDSPIFAGRHFRRWDLGHGAAMNVIADRPELIDLAPENHGKLRAMVDEAVTVFGSRPWDHYDLLVALSDRIGGIGLEHHRSSENQLEPNNFVQWTAYDWDRNVLAHELSHSWVGKFRRPARMWTPDYRQPMQDNLLWVYEGQNQFWGIVLAARSGLQSKDVALGMLASSAGLYSELPGRDWRSVEDTTHDPIFAARKPKPFISLARGEDYYNEGALVWLEADQLIREGTNGAKGLDDFARAFFGLRNGDYGQVTYEFEDVVAALNSAWPYDWASFLRQRIEAPGQPAPLAGIEKAGYKLVWKDEPNPYDKGRMGKTGALSLYHSLGITIARDGDVSGTRWDSPAFNAGLVTGTTIVAVNGEAYSENGLRRAITAARAGTPIELIVRRGQTYRTVSIDYRDGLRWPWLERSASGSDPAPLDRLFAPRGATTAP